MEKTTWSENKKEMVMRKQKNRKATDIGLHFSKIKKNK
jgi:hypothetical protein